ncbi:hypothetical protein [Nocardia sp. NPDC002869]|uniref:hypothetical protein n=1 Tax=Nocardia sp. NPDC002869 TaxID=3161032 RepID=UPI00398CBDE6
MDQHLREQAQTWARAGSRPPLPLPGGPGRERPPVLYYARVEDDSGSFTVRLPRHRPEPAGPAAAGDSGNRS